MAIPVILPTMLPNLVQPGTEAAKADQARRPVIPVITAVQPYAAIRSRHQDRERDRRQAAFEAWLGLHRGGFCPIGANPAMSRRLDVINRRYRSPEDSAGIELDIEA
ncbi:hypothetical protein [Oceanisphaera psychrotolerans]|uniref:Uncharacterized protein n=1 Tax=Oceanisphaera psychrotolerans TaxID=1414654 RepID=A0A1J4QC56_9GAMM|nr:hypothetical protein [Oceanisphaera psychrotolerans]OIN04762.1 hypothetical protein BFR47_05550 [Oceanisphaera psychrotolerans]